MYAPIQRDSIRAPTVWWLRCSRFPAAWASATHITAPSSPSRPAESGAALPSQKKCSGLRADAVDDDVRAADSFQRLCRVLDSKFSHVSAEMLFTLRVRAAAADADAVLAFDRLVGPERRGSSSTWWSRSSVAYSTTALATWRSPTCRSPRALVAEARRIDAKLGGMYEGRLLLLRRRRRRRRRPRACWDVVGSASAAAWSRSDG
tara:strand:+ start:117 stop:731 length:615 start_codon:yes stop_codon:yes gene_type:complete